MTGNSDRYEPKEWHEGVKLGSTVSDRPFQIVQDERKNINPSILKGKCSIFATILNTEGT